ncbi:GNAT family N-acetyltransferase [Alterisphingorhabdus coralli]|uniref:GNAT family N-acetyltransferase n=1 Tax=Alterisphingorhabdus coralli TaxID=3071408 RepID=A0AA97F843_9SPHN|nr:GNAT family N-acetyltransferase [Parasphingorhabdus sp. SCSIO 66989]WOE76089.1 GNAT family N-acetyltransferase [Parasphingorhabdus sp. SCSIO 66989]
MVESNAQAKVTVKVIECADRIAALDEVMDIMIAAFDPAYGEAWNRAQTQSMLMLPKTILWLVQCDKPASCNEGLDPNSIGFAITSGHGDELELMLVAIMPEWRSRGIGQTLLHAIFQDARKAGVVKLFVEMRHNNIASSFYDSLGFTRIGRRKNYYTGTHGQKLDAITMVKAIS